MEIIGIHTPETEREKVEANVVEQVTKLKVTHPVLLDQKGENWRRWSQMWWPTVYLVDKDGDVVYRWAGELDWKGAGGEEIMGKLIERLIKE